MDNIELAYLLERARQERQCAARSAHRSAALVHNEMAQEYERRARKLLVPAGQQLVRAEI